VDVGELGGEHAGLLQSELVQLDVRGALDPEVAIPVGLPVAGEKKRRLGD
jgi:hypothetical protein